MADFSLAEEVLNLLSKFDPDKAEQFLSNLQNLAPQATASLDGVNRKIKETTELSKETSEGVNSILDGFKKLGTDGLQYISNLTKNISAVNPALVSVTGQAGLLLGALTGIIPSAEGFKILGKSAKDSGADLEGTLKTLEKIPGLGRAIKPLGSFLEIAEPAKMFSSGMIRVAAETGTLGDLFAEVGTNLEGMTYKALKFSQQTQELGNATGLSSKQISEYALQLMKIPGALDQIVTVEPGTNYLNFLDAALKTAAGTGQDFNDVVEQTSFMFQELGVSGRPVLENISRISAASSGLRMQLSDVRDFTRSAALNFKFLGDNTQASLNILDRFGGSLQETGLGNKAVIETSRGVIDSISKMSIAQQAFLSGQTGGPGGLTGAFQIDLLKQQGKIDEVFKMVEQSLRKQFGGRIVTLEEGARDQRLAGQLMKQVALLTEGPTKIAGSKEEAYKILEAMQKGMATTQIASTETAFKQALETGDKIQERQYNQLVIIENELNKIANFSSLSALALSRQVLGTGGQINEVNIRNLREQASQLAAVFSEKIQPDEIKGSGLELSKTINESFKNLGPTITGAGRFLEGLGSNLITEVGKTGKEMFPNLSAPEKSTRQTTLTPISPEVIRANEPGRPMTERTENLQITMQATCQNCQQEIARKEVLKQGSKLIDQYDTGKAIFAHTGVSTLP